MAPKYKVTPRNLGSLELPGACLADFWYLSKLNFRAPYNNFGAALFNDCQSIEEAMIGYYLEKDRCLPQQFAPFCDVKARVDVNKHWSKFGYLHQSGVWLYGSPDEVFYRKDGSIVIWDHKTAHPKSDQAQDRFRPQYEIQVTGYGMIAEFGLDLGRVSAGALGYWDMQIDPVIKSPSKFIRDGMLWASFVPKVFPVKIDYTRVERLLKEAVKIWNSKTPPAGREGCPDCKKLAALIAIQCSVENQLTVQDQQAIWRSGNDPAVYRRIARYRDTAWARRLAALKELQDAESPGNCQGTVSANWEFLDLQEM